MNYPMHAETTQSKSGEILRQEQNRERMGRIAGAVAHDFNNLLGIILGYSDLLLQAPALDPKSRRKIGHIQQAARSAAALTRQPLAFSRQQFVQRAALSFNELVLQMAGMLRRLLREDIKFSTALEAKGGTIMADPT